jgi:hypothetical protein
MIKMLTFATREEWLEARKNTIDGCGVQREGRMAYMRNDIAVTKARNG